MNKKVLAGIGILVVILVLVFFIKSAPGGELIIDENNKQVNLPLEEVSGEDDPNTISTSELSKHNSKDDCWIVYKNKVYDITSYISRHPGGENKIVRNCGDPVKFEEDFTNKHGTSKASLLMNVGTFIGDFDIIGILN